MNGGAIIALLALIGQMLTRPETSPSLRPILEGSQQVFFPFVVGLALAALANGFAYLNFGAVLELLPSAGGLHDWLYGKTKERSKGVKLLEITSRIAAIGCCSVSMGLFLYGCWNVLRLFQALATDLPIGETLSHHIEREFFRVIGLPGR